MGLAKFFIDPDVFGLNGDFSTHGHGITGIDAQVYQNLLDLPPVGSYGPEVMAGDCLKRNVFADHAPEHFRYIRNYLIQVKIIEFEHLPAAEGQELIYKRGRAFGSLHHLFHFRVGRAVGTHIVQCQVGVSLNYLQKVVEIVGHTAGQLTDRLHFLGMAQLGLCLVPLVFRLPALGDVPARSLELDHFSLVIENDSIGPSVPSQITIRHNAAVFMCYNRIFPPQGIKAFFDPQTILTRDTRYETLPDDIITAQIKVPAVCLVYKGDRAVG